MTSPEHPDLNRIAIFGGGGGGSVMAAGLVEVLPDAHISVIVPTGDSGSKTGELRELFGGPAVGDTRKVLSAVAGNREAGELFGKRFISDETLQDDCLNLFDSIVATGKKSADVGYVMSRTLDLADMLRDEDKSLSGHTLGNLVLTAMGNDNKHDVVANVRTVSDWLDARADVIPVSAEPHNLVMYDKARKLIIKGEGFIDDYVPTDPSQVDVWLEPSPFSENRFIEDRDKIAEILAAREFMRKPAATKEAVGAIALSGLSVLAPGSPWTTQEDMLQQEGVPSALQFQQQRGGLWVVINNLFEEKPGLDFRTHVRIIENSAGRSPTHYIHNTDTEGLPEGKVPYRFDPNEFELGDAKAISGALVDSNLVKPHPSDPIAHLRSPGHHNAWKVAGLLGDIVKAV